MLIANPIFDTVFKYLMKDLSIARGVLSTIIGREIKHLEFRAQEQVVKREERTALFHLDFSARIKQEDGEYTNVLIELQKAYTKTDILRFRRYLGEQYKQTEPVTRSDGKTIEETLPIITIYFLGYYISKSLPGIIFINRQYLDGQSGHKLKERHKFIECLTHDSYIIQIPALKLEMKTRLEYVLSIFKQENFINKDHHLKDYKYKPKDDLMDKILKQLEKAAADTKLLTELENEEMARIEFEWNFGHFEETLEQNIKIMRHNEKTIKKKDKALEKKDKKLEIKDKTIKDKDKALKEKDSLIHKLQRQLEEKK